MILDKIVLVAVLTAPTQAAMLTQASGGPANGVMSGDSVPDVEAYKALFLVLSDGPNPVPRADRQSLLTPSGLSAAEIGIVIDAADQYRIHVDQASRRD